MDEQIPDSPLSESDEVEGNTDWNDESDSGPKPIETERLILRRFEEADAYRTYQLINDPEIAANTRTIPYPYPEELAVEWIRKHRGQWISGKGVVFAICCKPEFGAEPDSSAEEDGVTSQAYLVGAIGLQISPENHNAEMGYWVGRDYRGKGYCTEAAAALLEFGFEVLALHRIHAHHLARNPASGRIMEKLGMEKEGHMKQNVRKNGVFEDTVHYAIINPQKR
ncbi:MAG: GNAT family N-acetyltransferase [Planctomycetota bacterium]